MGSRILIVDGSGLSREALARAVRQSIDEVVVAVCGTARAALERLGEGRFDLLTTSLLLPDMDGLALCRHIRHSERHCFTPVVVVSGDADDRLLREGFAAGVTDYFEKSAGYRAFGEFIRRVLDRHRQLRGRILLVEDSRDAALGVQQTLERYGLEVHWATRAEEAARLLSRNGEEPAGFDLIITDFHFSEGITGGDLLYLLRVQQRYSPQELPVLMLTGDGGLQHQAEAYYVGANDFIAKSLSDDVLLARVRALLLIKEQYETLRLQAEKLQQLALTDGLTGLYNRRYLLEANFAATQPLTLLLLDLDHFKAINDNHGHLVGDRVLQAMAERIKTTGGEGVRFGGEEFLVLLPGRGRRTGVALAEALRRDVESTPLAGISATLSVGVASTEDHPGLDLNRLLGLADEALYAAKEGGRNRVVAANWAAAELVDPSPRPAR